jgi:hypothetical protein
MCVRKCYDSCSFAVLLICSFHTLYEKVGCYQINCLGQWFLKLGPWTPYSLQAGSESKWFSSSHDHQSHHQSKWCLMNIQILAQHSKWEHCLKIFKICPCQYLENWNTGTTTNTNKRTNGMLVSLVKNMGWSYGTSWHIVFEEKEKF